MPVQGKDTLSPQRCRRCERCRREFSVYPYRAATARFCSAGCSWKTMREAQRGAKVWNYKAARSPSAAGYMRIRVDGVLVYEHRHVMERMLGRPLYRDEHVHHINGVRGDNRPENLRVESAYSHNRRHTVERWQRGTMRGANRRFCGALGYRRKPCRQYLPCRFHRG